MLATDLLGPVDLDLQDHVGARREPRAWACRRSCPRKSVHSRNPPGAIRSSKAARVVEHVGVVGLARPLRARVVHERLNHRPGRAR